MTQTTRASRCSSLALVAAVLSACARRQVTSAAPGCNAAKEPQNWLTYSGDYSSQRYSPLDQITPANVKNLELKWIYQSRSPELAGDAARRRRHHVRHAAAERRRRARCRRPAARSGSTATRPPGSIVCCGVEQSRRSRFSATRCSWARSTRSWSRSTRRAAGRSGRRAVAEHASRLLDDAGAARRQGQGDRRRRRRRIRHSRLHRRVRRARPGRKPGASTRFPGPASPATKRGSAVRRIQRPTAIPRRGSTAADRSG